MKTKKSHASTTSKSAGAKSSTATPAAKKPHAKSHRSNATTPTVVTPGQPPPAGSPKIDGSAEAVAEFLPQAQAIPQAQVLRFRGEAARAVRNVDLGLAALAPVEAQLTNLPAPFDLTKMKSLHRLGLAVVFAAAHVDRASPGTVPVLLARAGELRGLLLSNAIGLAKAGVVPASEVKRIQAGRGARDQAQDCVDLVQLFRDHAADVAGKTPIVPAQLDEAWSVGNQLLATLKPARTKHKPSSAVQSTVDTRDRLWTLLNQWHDGQLRRAGMWIWTDKVDAHVPPLLAGAVHHKKKAASAPNAAPATGPAATPATPPAAPAAAGKAP